MAIAGTIERISWHRYNDEDFGDPRAQAICEALGPWASWIGTEGPRGRFERLAAALWDEEAAARSVKREEPWWELDGPVLVSDVQITEALGARAADIPEGATLRQRATVAACSETTIRWIKLPGSPVAMFIDSEHDRARALESDGTVTVLERADGPRMCEKKHRRRIMRYLHALELELELELVKNGFVPEVRLLTHGQLVTIDEHELEVHDRLDNGWVIAAKPGKASIVLIEPCGEWHVDPREIWEGGYRLRLWTGPASDAPASYLSLHDAE